MKKHENMDTHDPSEKYFRIRPTLQVNPPVHLENDIINRWKMGSRNTSPFWTWAAAIIILAINSLAITGIFRVEKGVEAVSEEETSASSMAVLPLEDEYPFWAKNEEQ